MEVVDIKGNTGDGDKSSAKSNVSEQERWASVVSGSALVLLGLGSRSLRGALTAIAGGSLIYHGATAEKSLPEMIGLNSSIKVEKTVTINRTAEDLYQFWRNFENLPRFMKHLKSVTVISNTRSHWITSAPLGSSVEWDAEIINDQENQLIAWASVTGADVNNSGFVRFKPAPRDLGTEVKIVMEYEAPGGVVGAAIAKLFGEEPEQQIGDELHRFKQLMETGEVATTEGQSACHR